jgi:hypothetical protein
MKRALLPLIFITLTFAQNNATKESNNTVKSPEKNITVENNNSQIEKNLKEQMEREKKYQAEQKFYQGDDYNLKEHEVDKESIDKVPVIEPEYDFDITDLYAD